MYKSPRLPGLCAGVGATGGRAVEPRRADYAYDVDAAPEARRARRRRRRRGNTLASPRRTILALAAASARPEKSLSNGRRSGQIRPPIATQPILRVKKGRNGTMFFIILGNLEPRPQRLCCSAPQRAVRDAGCPGNTCGSAALHALPRAAARRGARHRGGGNLRGDRWQKRSAVDGWTAAGGGPAVHVRAVLVLIWRYKADADDAVPTTRCRDAAAIVRKKITST